MTDSNLLAGAQWSLRSTTPGSADAPADLTGDSIPAVVPGTVASALRAAGAETDGLDSLDWWYTTTVDGLAGTVRLECDGLATVVDVWVGGVRVAESTSMFVPLVVDLELPGGPTEIALHCRSLDTHLKKRRPRGRWRSSMVSAQGLRWVRTTMLGRAPVFSGAEAPVGPWRAVRLLTDASEVDLTVSGRWDGTVGLLRVHGIVPDATDLTVTIAGQSFVVSANADIDVAGVEPWWPHTHGTPQVYPVEIRASGRTVHRSTVGFRTVDLEPESMTLSVNGIRVFCRGGCWVPLDPVGLQNDPAVLDSVLTAVRDAGLNMIRITGTMVYEDDSFFERCSALGILVWQDLMIATLDPPDDPDFQQAVLDEVRALVRTRSSHPSLAVISGGSETHQQPTMLGLAAGDFSMPLLDNVIPGLLGDVAPGVTYVPSSPSGGDLATHVGSGVAHYFGVGGYLRPLADIRSAGVRFAAECLAFSVPPSRRTVDRVFGSANVAGHDPVWKAAVPRDRGSSWDFEDVRDHYVRTLFGVEPSDVRRDDAERYLDLGSAAVCEAVTAGYSYWRSPRSGCGGALVLTLLDLEPGAGWGLIDSGRQPKAPWYPLARASAPVALLVTDEGMDGVRIDVVNDTARAVSGTVSVTAHTRTGTVGAAGEVPVVVPAHGHVATTVDAVIGHFTDATHAHRFGPRTYDAITVELVGDMGDVLARDVHLVGGSALPLQNSVGLTARAAVDESGDWALEVRTDFAAQYVCIDVDGYRPLDSWFHLAPGTTRTVPLTPDGSDRPPTGHVRALNSLARAVISRDP